MEEDDFIDLEQLLWDQLYPDGELKFYFKEKYYHAYMIGLGTYVEYGNEEKGVTIDEITFDE